jgi:endonuclease/exonuclease/phosphatase family metal-dependent hydrolase
MPQEQFEANAASRYTTVLRNDFTRRARALAAEVKKTKPDLIALQEAAIWRRGPKDGSATPATDVVYDSTALLRQALQARGMTYRVVVARSWFDFEAPLGAPYNIDARLTQRDVVLRRASSRVKVRNVFRGGFKDTLNVPTQAGLAVQSRGWVGLDGVLAKRKFRLITTHLEAYSAAIAAKQMNQLLAGPAKSRSRRTILMGDFNSSPGANDEDDRNADRSQSAYLEAIDAGFAQLFPRRDTCCFGEDLRKPDSLDRGKWIDHIVVRRKKRFKLIRSGIVGTAQVGGLYPSDHAGITGTLRLR